MEFYKCNTHAREFYYDVDLLGLQISSLLFNPNHFIAILLGKMWLIVVIWPIFLKFGLYCPILWRYDSAGRGRGGPCCHNRAPVFCREKSRRELFSKITRIDLAYL